MKVAIRELGSRAIDRRTLVGRALAAWRSELIDDLGGPERVSTQQAALVDLVTREKLLLDSIDAYLAEQGGKIINRAKRSLIPIVRERAQLADSFARRLVALGLERRAREPQDLGSYLAAREGNGKATPACQAARGGALEDRGEPSTGAGGEAARVDEMDETRGVEADADTAPPGEESEESPEPEEPGQPIAGDQFEPEDEPEEPAP